LGFRRLSSSMADADAQKRIKALNKKLGQIAKLKEKDQLTQEETEKVSSGSNILKEIRALERGESLEQAHAPAAKPAAPAKQPEEVSPSAQSDEGASPQAASETEAVREAPAAAPVEEEAAAEEEKPQLEPAEAEKRIKAVRKKLAQIEKLQEKGPNLLPEEKEKVSRKAGFEAEIRELELNLLDPEERKNAFTIQKKLDQIRKLKEKGGQLNAQEREKVNKQAALKKELDEIMATGAKA